MADIVLTINCYNKFRQRRWSKNYFWRWWHHIETNVIKPYRDSLDIAVYDDGSNETGMLQFLFNLKKQGRIDWLTLGPDRNAEYPFAKHAFGNFGYAYSLQGWQSHKYMLHFDTDIWFVRPGMDRGFDWLGACVRKLEDDPTTFAASLWGCLWQNGTNFVNRAPGMFRLKRGSPWSKSAFFSTRQFLVRTTDLTANLSRRALTEIGRPGKTRDRRKGLIGKIDSYERMANRLLAGRTVAILGMETGVITRHLKTLDDVAKIRRRLGMRGAPKKIRMGEIRMGPELPRNLCGLLKRKRLS